MNEEGGFWDLHDPAGSFFGGILIRGPPALGSPLGGGGGGNAEDRLRMLDNVPS